jgi:hypothetical protein
MAADGISKKYQILKVEFKNNSHARVAAFGI